MTGRRLRLHAVGPVGSWGRPGPAPETPSTPFPKYSSSNSPNGPPGALLTLLSSPGLHLPVTSAALQPGPLPELRTQGRFPPTPPPASVKDGWGRCGRCGAREQHATRGASGRPLPALGRRAPVQRTPQTGLAAGPAGGRRGEGRPRVPPAEAPAPGRGPGSGETREPGAPGAALLGALEDKPSWSPCHCAPAISAEAEPGDAAEPHGTWEPERPPEAPSVPRAPYVRLESWGAGVQQPR